MSDEPVVVIGAGVVGISCARWLQHDGHRVCVVDPEAPGRGCSWGNAGVFAVDSVGPVATPRTLRAVPRMLVARSGPLRLAAADLPHLAPWLLTFALQARPRAVAAASASLAALCARALPDFDPITRNSAAAELMRPTGWATVFENRRSLRAARADVATLAAHGWPVCWLDRAELRERLAGLSTQVVGGFESSGAWMCTDPCRFVEHLAADAAGAGAVFERRRVTRIRPVDGGASVETEAGAMRARHVVVAAGIDSAGLAVDLGDRLGLAPERGYHVMLGSGAGAPAMPVMAGEHKFVTTPMAAGVRVAGTSEFARARRPADPRCHAWMLERAGRLFPDLDTRDPRFWHGSRSTTPDSLPVIGRSAHSAAVTYACGHQHLGLTLAGVTGRLVADELAGRAPPLDPWPLRPNRFRLVG